MGRRCQIITTSLLRSVHAAQEAFASVQTYIDEQLVCFPSILSGFEARNPNLKQWQVELQKQDEQGEGRPVVMLKGFHTGHRGELVAMSNHMADWLTVCGYVRDATEADFAARRKRRRRPIKGVRQLSRARLIHGGS